jgi:fumarylpyruvate hydrolase
MTIESRNQEEEVDEMDRKTMLQSSGALAVGAAAGYTIPNRVSGQKTFTPFEVEQTTIPIVGSADRFPVRRIYCIGRNYAAHAIEMGADPTRTPPFFFQKPSDAVQVVPTGETADHPYPPLTQNYHYEIELVAALRSGGRDIPIETALDCVFGYTVGLDMTRRDLQAAMKEQAKPWEVGKSFDRSAPMGPIHTVAEVGHFSEGTISLSVNGELKQNADLNQMIWQVAEQISKLSEGNELMPGDIIFSGTPENVGPVVPGDVMVGRIHGLTELSVRVV